MQGRRESTHWRYRHITSPRSKPVWRKYRKKSAPRNGCGMVQKGAGIKTRKKRPRQGKESNMARGDT